MQLTVDNIVPHLMSAGLIDVSDLFAGDLHAVDASRRNRNLRVVRPGKVSYLVKQRDLADPTTVATLARERAFCAHVHSTAGPLTQLVPELLLGDDVGGYGVFRLFEGAVPLWAIAAEGDSLVPAAGALGAALACLHALEDGERLSGLSDQAPWVLQLHRPTAAILGTLSPAGLAILRTLQADEALVGAMDEAGAAWRPTGIIHGDVKGDNVLIVSSGKPLVRLVDWELVQRGDRAWDVGGAFADLLSAWIRTVPYDGSTSFAAASAGASCPIQRVQQAIRALWSEYRTTKTLPVAEREAFLERSAVHAAARLVQSAWEASHDDTVPSAFATMCLQVASNVARDPARALLELFGLPREWPGVTDR